MAVKPKAKTEKKSASKNEFIAGLKGDKLKKLKEAAKSERSGGDFSTDEEVLEIYGIEEGVKVQTNVKLVAVHFGRDKNKKRYMSFQFVDVGDDDDTKGTQFSKYFTLAPAKGAKTAKEKEESEDKAYVRLFQFFQSLEFDTKKWKNPLGDACDAAKELTKDKPVCKVTLSCWGDEFDRLGIDVKAIIDGEDDEDEEDDDEEDEKPSRKSKNAKSKKSKDDDDDDDDDDEEEDEDDDDEEEEEEEEKPKRSGKSSKASAKSRSSKKKKDEDEEEDEDEDDEEDDDEDEDEKPVKGKAKGKAKAKAKDEDEDDEDEEEEPDYKSWIDYEAWYTPKGKRKKIAVTITKWNAKKKVFTVHSEIMDEDYIVAPDDLEFDEE